MKYGVKRAWWQFGSFSKKSILIDIEVIYDSVISTHSSEFNMKKYHDYRDSCPPGDEIRLFQWHFQSLTWIQPAPNQLSLFQKSWPSIASSTIHCIRRHSHSQSLSPRALVPKKWTSKAAPFLVLTSALIECLSFMDKIYQI